jgi:hypothetical protein
LIPHRLFADVENSNGDFIISPEYSCYLDIPYDLMADNLLDLAHIDFTHDGTVGKRSQASWIRSEQITPSSFLSMNSESASYKLTRLEPTGPPQAFEYSYFHFIPPCFNRIEHYGPKKEKLFFQTFFNLPSAENKMRLILRFYRNFARYKWIEYIPGYDYLVDKLNWKVVDQDVLLLNGIHRNITEMGAKPLGKTVSADAPIKAFRRFQTRALLKYGTIYMKQGAWETTATNKSSDDGIDEVDIEDLKME